MAVCSTLFLEYSLYLSGEKKLTVVRMRHDFDTLTSLDIRNPFALLVVVIVLAVTSCSGNRKVLRQLKDIESYHIEYCDSAQAALRDIDVSKLKSRLAAARYSLLSGATRLFQGEVIDDYSSIHPAVSYYTKGRGTVEERIGCRILLSNFHYAREEYDVALLDIAQAEELSERCKDPLVIGLVQLFKSDILWDLHADVELVQCCRNAYDIFSGTSSNLMTGLALMYLGQSYYRTGVADSAVVCYDRILDAPDRYGRDWFYPEAMFHKAEALMSLEKPDCSLVRGLIENALQLKKFEENATIKALYAYVVSRETGGDVSVLVNDALEEMSFYDDTEDAAYWLSRLCLERGDLKAAYSYLDQSFDERLETDAVVYTHSVYRALQESRQHHAAQVRNIAIAVFVLSVLLVIVVVFVAILLIARHKANAEKLEADAVILNAKLSDEQALQNRQGQELMTRVENINRIFDILQVKMNGAVPKDINKEEVFKAFVADAINDTLFGIDSIDAIREQVETRYPGMREALEKLSPSLTPLEKKILFLSIIGYSTQIISFLCKMSQATYYSHKSRVKGRLKSSGDPVLVRVSENL